MDAKSPSRKHPGLELIDARLRLAATPESAPALRKLRQLQVQNLEKELHIPPTKRVSPRPSQDKDHVERADGLPEPAVVEPPNDETPGDTRERGEGQMARGPQGGGASEEGETQIVLTAPQRETMYREVREDIKSTDQKAMFFLVVLVWVLVFLINRNATTSWFYGPSGWLFKDFVSFMGVLGLVASASMMLRVLYPSHKEFNPLKLLAVKQILLRRGFWIGAVAAFLALLFLILSKKPHQTSYRVY
jgi:hypothetical protein